MTSTVAEGSDREAFPLIGHTIDGKYAITGGIARGGMGRVYRAQQLALGRKVALKTLSPLDDSIGHDAFRRRFSFEAAVYAKLTHPNTVRVYDHGFDGEVCYIVMELLEGSSLCQLVRSEGPLPPLRAIHVAKQLCGALAEAHQRQIVHRDLKPSNVLICPREEDRSFVKLVDFGIAKAVKLDDVRERPARSLEQIGTGRIVGSPHYVSPEQIRGLAIDGRADVYALGVCLFFMLTGRTPFEDRENLAEVLSAQLSTEAPRPEAPGVWIPDSLADVIARCLERDRSLRIPNMKDLRRALRLVEAELTGHTPPTDDGSSDTISTPLPRLDPRPSANRSPAHPTWTSHPGPEDQNGLWWALAVVISSLVLAIFGLTAALLVVLFGDLGPQAPPAPLPPPALAVPAEPPPAPAPTEALPQAPPEAEAPPAPVDPVQPRAGAAPIAPKRPKARPAPRPSASAPAPSSWRIDQDEILDPFGK